LVEGEAHIVDFDLATLKTYPILRRKIGIVFQDFKLPTVRLKTICCLYLKRQDGPLKRMDRKIDEVLDKVGMKDYASKMPHQISGGEQQRVAIARVANDDPNLSLLMSQQEI
jgi:cell division transport system ATP-binding protein